MVIVDSTVWIDYLAARENPETMWLRREMPQRRVGLTNLILCEVLQGVREGDAERVREELMSMRLFANGGVELAVAAAENYRLLRGQGITVRKTIDCWIATFCIEHGHSLLHRDRNFEAFERHLGLRVIHP
jgi:predicted nucleic acid-binding protein